MGQQLRFVGQVFFTSEHPIDLIILISQMNILYTAGGINLLNIYKENVFFQQVFSA